MPRAHTDDERERIQQRLLDAGRDGFVRIGLAKVTIAQLARAAGVGKGTFYTFFASKEALFLAVQEREEAAFKEALVQELEAASSGRDAVRALLLTVATRLEAHPFLSLVLDQTTLAALTLRVPKPELEAHQHADREFFTKLLRSWKRRGWIARDVDVPAAFDVLTALFLVSLQRELIGEAAVRRAVAEIAEACAMRWCPPP